MSAATYWLVQTAPGAASRIVEELRAIEAVDEAVAVGGPYDVIVRSTGADALTAVGSKLRAMDGVLRILPCLPFGTARLDDAMVEPA